MKISHSDPHNLTLGQHNKNVQIASLILAKQHSPESVLRGGDLVFILRTASLLHDAGKVIEEFQKYIADPKAWRGDPMKKAHALIGSVIAGQHLHSQGVPAPIVLAIVYMIAGHHTRLPLRKDYALNFSSPEIRATLAQQLASLDLNELSEIIGSDLRSSFGEQPLTKLSQFKHLLNDLWDQMPTDLAKLWNFRVKTQFAFSCLLEADRAQLIMGDLEKYTQPIDGTPLTQHKIDSYVEGRPPTNINDTRDEAASKVLEQLEIPHDNRIYTLSLPTGFGKTAIAARWAARCMEKWGPKKVIVVQPYLTITRQTEGVYRAILGEEKTGATLMPYHSISEPYYADTELAGRNQQQFYLDTWKSGVIVTTYDQLLLVMFSPKTKHQMRFHNLSDALIILDEFQALPTLLWEPVSQMLDHVTRMGDSRVLAMSASAPHFFEKAHRLLTLEDRDKFRATYKRYEIFFDHKNPQTISEFCESLAVDNWITYKKRVMIVVNTRRAARKIRDFLLDKMPDKSRDKILYLSTDITPKQRDAVIQKVNQDQPCILVSTQCIEAGVDIDMDLIYSDFAPLDSLLQRAGRENRHGLKGICPLYVITLKDDAGRIDADKIYDGTHLAVTRELVRTIGQSIEEDALPLYCDVYFRKLRAKKNTGTVLAENFITWEEDLDARGILRGDQDKREIQFLVEEQDPLIVNDIETALGIEDRFERRQALRDLVPRIAEITISRYAYECPDPDKISEQVGPFRVLKEGQYQTFKGLETDKE